MLALGPIEDAFNDVRQLDDMAAPMRLLARAAGMTHYLALRLRGISGAAVMQLIHNAPASHIERCEDASYWRDSPLVKRLLAPSAPIIYEGNVEWPAPADIPGFEHGVAAGLLEPRGSCLMFLGRSTPKVGEAEQMDCMLAATLGIGRVLDCLTRLQVTECPLSSRQLDCLRHAMAGHTAAQTALALGISARTVEQYLTRAREHLEAPTSLAAAVVAIDHGWLHPSEVRALVAA